MAEIEDFSTTAAANTDLFPSDTLLVTSIDNNLRELQAAIRRRWNDAEWFEFKDGTPGGTITVTSSTQFRVEGIDVTSVYTQGRRVRAVGATTGTIYGSITSSTLSGGNTTVNVAFDSGSLTVESVTISISIISSENSSSPAKIGHDFEVDGDVTANNLTRPVQKVTTFRKTNRQRFDGNNRVLIETLSVNKERSDSDMIVDFAISFEDRALDNKVALVACEIDGQNRRFLLPTTEIGSQTFNIAVGKAVFSGLASGSKTIRFRFERGDRAMSFVINPSTADSARLSVGRPESAYIISEF